ncbi:MAG: lipopolysaccharide biosynthesis protein [Thauera sp.]|nr:lipopolysaccharide biosynthesis protein [Thauera sp.]
MSLGNNLRRGALWLFIGNTGNQILGFLLGIILARILVPEDFGMILTIQIFTGLVGMVSGGGMGQALVRAKEATHADYNVVFTLQLAIGIAIYGCFFAVAPWFADWYRTPLYADLLRVSALSFILRPFVNLPSNMLHREMRYKAKAMMQLINLLLSNSLAIGMGLSGYGVWSLTVSGLICSAISSLILMHVSGWRPSLTANFSRARELARYGMLASANDIVVYLQQQVSTFVLSRGAGPTAVGHYNKADSIAYLPQRFVTGSVYDVLFRALAKEQDNLDLSRYLYFRSITLVALYALPLYVGLYFVAEPLILLLYGSRWLEAAAPISVLVMAGPFMIVENLSGAVLAARNKLGKELVVQVLMLVILVLAVLAGIPYGLTGVAVAFVTASVYRMFHMYWLASRALEARPAKLLAALSGPLLITALMALALVLADSMQPIDVSGNGLLYLVYMGSIGGAVYAALFFMLPIAEIRSESARWKAKIVPLLRRSAKQ